jgi:hypothetical protein
MVDQVIQVLGSLLNVRVLTWSLLSLRAAVRRRVAPTALLTTRPDERGDEWIRPVEQRAQRRPISTLGTSGSPRGLRLEARAWILP